MIGPSAVNRASKLAIYENDGAGNLTLNQSYVLGGAAYISHIADLDGGQDGLDLVTFTDPAILSVMGNADGTLPDPSTQYATGSGPEDLDSYDIDSDGDLDLIVTAYTASTLDVFKNNGDGTFAARITVATVSSPSVIAIGDYDEDGIDDVAVAGATAIRIHKNDGSGTLTNPYADISYASGNGTSLIAGGF